MKHHLRKQFEQTDVATVMKDDSSNPETIIQIARTYATLIDAQAAQLRLLLAD